MATASKYIEKIQRNSTMRPWSWTEYTPKTMVSRKVGTNTTANGSVSRLSSLEPSAHMKITIFSVPVHSSTLYKMR
eukprot:CAMPEP_0198501688 /NCGR_PEP_ID=MMETSP1462-20131121/8862_1 /TAXON_ID=1333877 /ORGANISM="Brandtodinium nutriculum, Strain RCC3387" /LENGTH=75 /DNA_ID=CAMNT_0044230741 /DNA_START=318 /DNA_END=545 /DNA_ORIENTATION=-